MDFTVYDRYVTPQLTEMEEGALVTERIPATLIERYFGKGQNLYKDIFYTPFILANHLIENGTSVTGIVREKEKSSPLN